MEFENVTVLYSYYTSPNRLIEEFERFLDELGHSIQREGTGKRIIITGDINSKSVIWGSRNNDQRESVMQECNS